MAKAKKTETTAAAKDSTSASAPKKKATKAKAPAAPSSPPMIDTGLAAENAAKLVFAKVAPPATPAMGGGGAAKESASFKNLKASLNKPASGMSTFLDRTGGPGQKKSNQPMGGGKQVGRNQTFGADVNRTGVPRRTGG